MAKIPEQAYFRFSDSPILDGFDVLCKTWFKVIKDYANICENKDAIYWYNERASLSSFSAALGRRGITFMEEYGCLKGQGKAKENKADLVQGRADLCFFHNESWYLVEAKQSWRYFTAKGLDFSPADAVKKACADAKCSWNGDTGCHALGLVFVTVGFAPKLHGNVQPLLSEFIHSLPERPHCDFLAYCAPNSLRNLQGQSGWRFPLVLLLGAVARNAR